MAKLTSKIALELVGRIELLKEAINAVYREASDYDGIGNVNLIRDLVKLREAAAHSALEAEGLLAAIDIDE